MKQYSYDEVRSAVSGKGYRWFTEPYDLNVTGIRKENKTGDYFDDLLVVSYIDHDGMPFSHHIKVTTEPGTYYLKNPMSKSGCAILKPGYYPGLWKPGLHKGSHALVQVNPCTVIRDDNRDEIRDHRYKKEETGIFGIDFHGPHGYHIQTKVGKWSAGCQVACMMAPVVFVVGLVAVQKQFIKSDSVSYALLLESDL